jgi:hypothetical protein
LFGETPRWGDTLKPFLWTNLSATIPGFRESIQIELPVACTYDFEIAAAKYFHSLRRDSALDDVQRYRIRKRCQRIAG